MKKCLVLLGAFFALCVPLSAFADGSCNCTCCNGGGLDASSCTNCVNFSPQDCTNFVQNATNELATITNDVAAARQYVTNTLNICGTLVTQVHDVSNCVDFAIDSLTGQNTNFSEVYSSLNSGLQTLVRLRDIALPVDGSNYSGIPSIIYTNTNTGASTVFGGTGRLSNRVRVATNYIHQAISILQNTAYDLDTRKQDSLLALKESYEYIGQILHYVEDIRSNLQIIDNNLTSINESAESTRALVSTVNCAVCAKSTSGGGGGTGGGGGGTIDFTPILQAIEDLKDELTYQLNRLYYLLENYYTDYDEARLTTPNYGSSYYGSGASAHNWFMRIEQLLAMISDPRQIGHDTVGDDGPTDPPEALEDTQEVQTLGEDSARNETNAESEKGAINQSLRDGWQLISTALTRFGNSLRGIGAAESSIDGMSLGLTYSTGEGTVDFFKIPSGTSARLSVVRTACNAVWVLICAVLYIYAFKLFFSLVLAYIAWFLKLASATFGS